MYRNKKSSSESKQDAKEQYTAVMKGKEKHNGNVAGTARAYDTPQTPSNAVVSIPSPKTIPSQYGSPIG